MTGAERDGATAAAKRRADGGPATRSINRRIGIGVLAARWATPRDVGEPTT